MSSSIRIWKLHIYELISIKVFGIVFYWNKSKKRRFQWTIRLKVWCVSKPSYWPVSKPSSRLPNMQDSSCYFPQNLSLWMKRTIRHSMINLIKETFMWNGSKVYFCNDLVAASKETRQDLLHQIGIHHTYFSDPKKQEAFVHV